MSMEVEAVSSVMGVLEALPSVAAFADAMSDAVIVAEAQGGSWS
jgi:hypothetical protein